MSEPESLPVESYTFASDEGIKSVVDKVRESGEPFTLSLNTNDFEAILSCLVHSALTVDSNELMERATSLASGIAGSVGVDWV